MKYEILYKGAFPLIRAILSQGEMIKAESDAMVSMSSTVDVEGSMEGGVLKGFTRMLAGEKFFFQRLTAKRGDGEVLLAPSLLGDVIDVELDGTYSLSVQKDGFLAGTQGIEVDTKMQNLSGKGTVFLSSYGSIHSINLEAGQEIVIDNNHLVAWPDHMEYKIEKAASGWISSFTSGEMLVCRFRGPGNILIQTRNPKGFAGWIRQFIPAK